MAQPQLAVFLGLLTSAALALPTEVASACPAYINAAALAEKLPTALQHTRQSWRLFTLSHGDLNQPGDYRWERRSLQVAPLSPEGVLARLDKEAAWQSAPLKPHDRLVLRPESFGQAFRSQAGFPCAAKHLIELRPPGAATERGYLAACSDHAQFSPLLGPVVHDVEHHQLSSALFKYTYQPNNQLIFSSLLAKDPVQNKFYKAAADASVLLHLDIKNFFSLNFSGDDVQSFVEASHTGELGTINRVQFYLRLLFFKLNLKLATTASYFADAAHLPMVIDVPLDAPSHLHEGSGMIFSWNTADSRFQIATDPQPLSGQILAAPPALIKQGHAALAAKGLSQCQDQMCLFRLRGHYGSQAFTIDMQVAKSLVERGFYPLWVEHFNSFTKALSWPQRRSGTDDTNQAAVYFNTSGLPRGQYTMDYWIRMGDTHGTCPQDVLVERVIDASLPQAH